VKRKVGSNALGKRSCRHIHISNQYVGVEKRPGFHCRIVVGNQIADDCFVSKGGGRGRAEVGIATQLAAVEE
jgi:hypothetical protein